MTPDETASYIRHHLKLAGRTDPLFTDDADRPDPPGRPRLAPRRQQRLRRRPDRHLPAAGKTIVDDASARAAIAEVTATD